MRDKGGEGADTRAQAVSQRALGPGRRSQRGRESGETRAAGKDGPRGGVLGRAQGERERSRPGGEGSWASAWIPGAFSFFLISFLFLFPKPFQTEF